MHRQQFARRFDPISQLKMLAAAVSVSLLALENGHADGSIDILRKWVAENIFVANDELGRPKLFVRRGPVRTYIQSGAASTVPEARSAIEIFSNIFGLSQEFIETQPNLIVAVAPEISDRGRPNRALLRQLGLPERAIDLINQDWSSGCGAHSFGDRNGRISASVIVAETRLGPSGIRDCIQTGVLYSFGLRLKYTSALSASQGYIQYLVLARALRFCGQQDTEEIGNASLKSVEDKYVECATEFIGGILR